MRPVKMSSGGFHYLILVVRAITVQGMDWPNVRTRVLAELQPDQPGERPPCTKSFF